MGLILKIRFVPSCPVSWIEYDERFTDLQHDEIPILKLISRVICFTLSWSSFCCFEFCNSNTWTRWLDSGDLV